MIELAGIIILGIIAQWLAWRFKIPAILPLIVIGLIVGPIAAEFITKDGTKLIEPVWNGEKGLFAGETLYYFVSLAISIILFEGGLTLKLDEVKNIGSVISRLITLGSAITFFGAAIAAKYVFGLSWEISFLFSALIIVTGPTVITPILRNIPLKKDVSAVLKWEGILIDPIGALVAVLVFEFISVEGGGEFTRTALIEFGKIVLFGITFGFTFAHGLNFAMNKKWIPHYLLNVFALASVLGVFVLSDVFAHESGLLSVVIMGMVLGNSKSKYLKDILYFKESLSVLLISILFILLAANINMDEIRLVLNTKSVILFAIVVFLIRPVAVFLSAYSSTLKTNEKLFISWVGPRGIVAAGIASLFGLKLANKGVLNAEFITPLVFMIVLGTVLLNATTARYFAKIAGVLLKKSDRILIIGASEPARLIAKYLKENGRHVVLLDTNPSNIQKAKQIGIEALNTSIYSDSLTDNIELNDVGVIIALTANKEINKFATEKLKEFFGENGAYRLLSVDEKNKTDLEEQKELFSLTDDYQSLVFIAHQYPNVYEIEINDKSHLTQLLKTIHKEKDVAPVFLKDKKEEIYVLSALSEEMAIEKGWKLVCLGRQIS